MATFYLALDPAGTGFTYASGYGRIVGMALSQAALRAQGFTANPYRGNRLSTIEHDDAGFDAGCEPGWYRTPNGVQLAQPETTARIALEATKRETHLTLGQFDEWHASLGALSGGHPARAHQDGCDYLLRARRAIYVVTYNRVGSTTPATSNNPTYTHAQLQAWLQAMRMGATDVSSPSAFYQAFDSGLLTGSTTDAQGRITYPHPPDIRVLGVWARPDNGTRLALNSSMVLTARDDPQVPTTVELAERDWVDSIPA